MLVNEYYIIIWNRLEIEYKLNLSPLLINLYYLQSYLMTDVNNN